MKMTELYHRAIARLYGWWRIAVNIPRSAKWDDEDFSRRDLFMIIRRGAESRYYHKHAEQQVCGCFAIGDHYTSYIMDCEEHGWDAIFPRDKFQGDIDNA